MMKECRERAMGEYRARRERGMSREGARMGAELDSAKREQERLARRDKEREQHASGCEVWLQPRPDWEEDLCTCGLTAGKGKGLGHWAGDQHPDGREGEGVGPPSRARKDISGYTHGEEPTDEDLLAYAEMRNSEADGGTYMLGLVIIYVMVAAVFFIIGLIYGRAVYGI